LPPGRYMISGPLPAVSVDSVVIVGRGGSYTSTPRGSVIAALSSFTSGSAMLSLAGEGNRLEDICVDGGGYAAILISVTGGHAQLTRIQAHHVAANGTCVAVAPGGSGTNSAESCWITDSVINGKTTSGNVGSPVQISPGSSSAPVNVAIASCLFQSQNLTADTYALAAVDTTNNGVSGLSITNACYGASANLPAYFVAAQTQVGAASANPEKIASAGCVCSGSNAWVGTSFYAADSTPTEARQG
jgi:hypothetical protein